MSDILGAGGWSDYAWAGDQAMPEGSGDEEQVFVDDVPRGRHDMQGSPNLIRILAARAEC